MILPTSWSVVNLPLLSLVVNKKPKPGYRLVIVMQYSVIQVK